MATVEIPSWLSVGAEVVEFTPTRMGNGGAHINRTTVKSIGKRDVVLANGGRYNVNRLKRSNGSWDPSTELLPPSDERVAQARLANRRSNCFNKAVDAWEDFRRTRSSEHATAVIDAVRGYLAALGGETVTTDRSDDDA